MDMKVAISLLIQSEMDAAAAAFNQTPNGDNWVRLQDAMWARQAVSSPDTLDTAAKTLADIGVGRWVKTLRNIHEGKGQTK